MNKSATLWEYRHRRLDHNMLEPSKNFDKLLNSTMTDDLKNKIEADFQNIQMEEPLEGHRERFQTKLMAQKAQKKRGRVVPLWLLVAAAACFCGALITITWTSINEDRQTFAQQRQLSDVSPEMNHIESWFTAEIELRKGELNLNDPVLAQGLKEMTILENEYEQLSLKLNENFGNEQIVSAMIKNYKLRLQILESIKKHINFKNRTKTKQDDKNGYNI